MNTPIPTTVNKTYSLKNCTGDIISILYKTNELVATVVYSHLSSGKLIITNIRKVTPEGILVKWLHSVDDNYNFDIGLSQDKLFWAPNESISTQYYNLFPKTVD